MPRALARAHIAPVIPIEVALRARHERLHLNYGSPAKPLRRAYASHDVHDEYLDEIRDFIEKLLPDSDRVEALFARMRHLPDNWDGDGATKPITKAIERASDVTHWAIANGLTVDDLSPDVLGGVAIYLHGATSGRVAWIACMNEGQDTAVLSDERSVERSFVLTGKVRKDVLSYLNG